MKEATQLIIFDCDGVLVDSEPLSIAALHKLLIDSGVTLTEHDVITRFQGRSLQSTMEEVRNEFGVRIPPSEIDRMNRELFEAFSHSLQPIEGVQEFLSTNKRAVCVASSSFPERIRHSLEATNLSHYFDSNVFSATMVKRGKPAPDLFLHAAQSTGYCPNECVVIEDSPYGIVAAKEAGMTAIGLVAGSHAQSPEFRRTLERAGADLIASSYQQLNRYLDSQINQPI